jgi:hypothetical protein
MDGFDELGVHDTDGSFMGFDYMSLIKGGAGMLSGAGGMFGGGGAAGGGDAAAAEKRRLEDDKRRAEQSATTWKIIGGIGLAVVAIGGAALALRRPAP